MHLFITSSIIDWDYIILQEPRILKHAKVMRLEIWENFLVQEMIWDTIYRRKIVCEEIQKKQIIWKVVSTAQQKQKTWPLVTIAVPLPNTLSKLDLIVQKLSEIWVDEIVFWTAKRSQIRKLSDKKISKACQISLESSQQAKSRNTPKVTYTKNIQEYCEKYTIIVLDQWWTNVIELFQQNILQVKKNTLWYLCVLWPEGWLTEEDYIHIWKLYTKIDLGESILRMETAARIGSWIIKQLSIDL